MYLISSHLCLPSLPSGTFLSPLSLSLCVSQFWGKGEKGGSFVRSFMHTWFLQSIRQSVSQSVRPSVRQSIHRLSALLCLLACLLAGWLVGHTCVYVRVEISLFLVFCTILRLRRLLLAGEARRGGMRHVVGWLVGWFVSLCPIQSSPIQSEMNLFVGLWGCVVVGGSRVDFSHDVQYTVQCGGGWMDGWMDGLLCLLPVRQSVRANDACMYVCSIEAQKKKKKKKKSAFAIFASSCMYGCMYVIL